MMRVNDKHRSTSPATRIGDKHEAKTSRDLATPTSGAKTYSPTTLVGTAKPGGGFIVFAYGVAERARNRVGLPLETWIDFLGVSGKTYARRAAQGVLDEKESIKVEMLQRVLDKATSVFEDEAVAAEWVTSPIVSLDNMRPIEHLTGIRGYERVVNTLSKIEYGMY